MKLVRFVVLAAALMAAASGHAQVQRVYVSAKTGDDANTATNCALATPCRWFGAAISRVFPGGEIVVLDSGAYGAFRIDRPVSVIAPEGIYAGITAFSGLGIDIDPGWAPVTLRGLTINGMGGYVGVNVASGTQVTLERCVVTNFPDGTGISAAADVHVNVLNSRIESNQYGISVAYGATVNVSTSSLLGNTTGLYLHGSGPSPVRVHLERSFVASNRSAISASAGAGGKAQLEIKESTIAGNRVEGILISGAPGAQVEASITASLVAGNHNVGIQATGAGASVLASGNTVTRNRLGFSQADGASFKSMGNNTVQGNEFNTSGVISSEARI